jgi:PncC family amidohydrolase
MNYEIVTSALINKISQATGRSMTICTAESATAGMIAARLANVPGCSLYFKGGIIAYSNEAKIKILGVKQETLERSGAVSSETVLEMAIGGRKLFKSDICIADTGIAGPDGGTVSKSVGLFYIGFASSQGAISKEFNLSGSRNKNREAITIYALRLLNEHLSNILV